MGFDVAADAYDQFMGRWSQPLASQLVEFAGVDAGQRVLDVGCGPGSLTSELVARLGPSAVAAVDPSTSFVAAARERNPGVDIRVAVAERLPFDDGTFDAALAQLVVHFMADPLAGIAEMARVTRPGGVIAACVWDYAGGRGPLGPFWTAARALNPDVEDESGLAGAREGHLTDLFQESSLRSVEGTALEVTRHHSGFEEWWHPFTRGVGPAGAYLASLDEHQQAELREHCRAMLPAGSFTITARAWAARGNT
ncbi:MAG TPA: methyltransferase domain-containing protein [Acidimicrobiia bacterium]|nr:methyltransferase domain-containing protein [Acidimicrobiia bacterium]